MSYGVGTYHDINHPYLTSTLVPGFPFHNKWQGQPLSPYVWLDPNRAGYRPYSNTMKITEVVPFEMDCAVYQLGTDIILPSNKCYAKDHQIILSP